MSVHWPIIRKLVTTPGREAVADDQRRWTCARLLIGSLLLADEIERRSASRTVGLLLPTSGLSPMAMLACWMLGRTPVPLNYLLKRDELQHVVDDCQTDLVLGVKPLVEFMGFSPRVRTLAFMEDLDLKRVPEPRWPARAADDELGALLYTSGTSGKPKGVMLTHGNLKANIGQCVRLARFSRDDVFFGVLPQFHSFGFTTLTLLPLTIGARVVYAARFVPHRILATMAQEKPTVFIAIPSMFTALAGSKSGSAADLASARFVVSGGEPLPDAVAQRFRERFGVTISEGYGLTETSPVTNVCLPWGYKRHSVGPAVPDLEQVIVDPDSGAVLPAGSDGEIRMRGPNVTSGYYRLPEETAEAFDESGRFRTGDIGRITSDGHLYITGRLKEMLIVGGENVFPREIEEVLNRHDTVAASGVVGMTDPVRGELPIAFVELSEGAAFDESALRGWCREHLAGYKQPREIRVVDALPRNPTGKILRRELKVYVDEGVGVG